MGNDLEEAIMHYQNRYFLSAAAHLEEYICKREGDIEEIAIELGKKIAHEFAAKNNYDMAIFILSHLGLDNEVICLEIMRDYKEVNGT